MQKKINLNQINVMMKSSHKAGVAVLDQLKEKFLESNSKHDRILLLTLAPKFWSRRDLQREFDCSEWEARQAKDLVSKKGILTLPDKRKGKKFSVETENLVKQFYERDNISRLMPGLKDVISVKQNDGKRINMQKRLLLSNLNELNTLFKNEYENVKISFAKFVQLRPAYCVLAGSSSIHVVCVYVHHENVKLMPNGIDLVRAGVPDSASSSDNCGGQSTRCRASPLIPLHRRG